jgi:hypothetical protein
MDKNKISSNNIKTIRGIFKGIKVKIYFADSRKNIFLQLSDMLAGLIHSFFKENLNYKTSIKTLKNKIKITQVE